ncbi:MAG: hypothetical protein WBC91_02620 [Phototrophicaceae bacterium]
MPDVKKLRHKHCIDLAHTSECNLLGVDDEFNIYAEEYYDYTYIAQHRLNFDGILSETRDEESGKISIELFDLSKMIALPQHPATHPLNSTGFRFRGMRQDDKIVEWVIPIPIQDKIPLLQALNLQISPMMLMGIAESRVLSQATLSPTMTIVCHMLRLLIALPDIKIDYMGLPYDYDTLILHVLHTYNPETDVSQPLHQALQLFPQLTTPTDCLLINEHLIVANSSDGTSKSEIHIFQFDDDNL